jgi:hypothetical protein
MPKLGNSSRLFIGLLAAFFLTATLSGCGTRNVRHSQIKRNLIEVDFVRQVTGFTTDERGFEHPVIISTERLIHILNAIEIEARVKKGGIVRQPAFHPAIVKRTAEALAQAFADVSPDQEIAVNVIHKQMRFGILHLKYLTSFLAYVDDGYLYLAIRRVEWPVAKGREGDPYPRPIRSKKPMDFRVVTGDPIYFAGVQDLEIDWSNEVFRTAFQLPGTSQGEKRRKEVLFQSPVPKEELEEASQGDIPYSQLSPQQLRALADLEEERREGLITETAYQRAKRDLLRKR